MGFFEKIIGKKSEKVLKDPLPWIHLNAISQIDTIKTKSVKVPQVIFKHSTTCGISRMVLNMFTDTFNLDSDQIDLYYLDIHSQREISNRIELDFGVRHESPQLLIIKNGESTFNISHGAIADIDLKEFIY